MVGKGLKELGRPRDSVYITTKIASLEPGETPRGLLTAALKDLGVDYVDLYLIHTVIPFLDREGGLPALWKELEQLQRDGLTKNIGISNFNADNLQSILEIAEIVPAVHQVGHFAQLRFYLWLNESPFADRNPPLSLQKTLYGTTGATRETRNHRLVVWTDPSAYQEPRWSFEATSCTDRQEIV